MRVTIFGLIALLLALPLCAQSKHENDASLDTSLYQRVKGTRWMVYAETKSDTAVQELYSFDTTRVAHLKSGFFRIWTRHDFATTQSWQQYSISHTYDWVIERQDVNCAALETMTLRRLLYAKVDENTADATWDWTARAKADFEWEAMVPDSTGETVLKLLCAQLRARQ